MLQKIRAVKLRNLGDISMQLVAIKCNNRIFEIKSISLWRKGVYKPCIRVDTTQLDSWISWYSNSEWASDKLCSVDIYRSRYSQSYFKHSHGLFDEGAESTPISPENLISRRYFLVGKQTQKPWCDWPLILFAFKLVYADY